MAVDGQIFEELEQIKSHHGIGTNTDLIRFLIRKEARIIEEKSNLQQIIAEA